MYLYNVENKSNVLCKYVADMNFFFFLCIKSRETEPRLNSLMEDFSIPCTWRLRYYYYFGICIGFKFCNFFWLLIDKCKIDFLFSNVNRYLFVKLKKNTNIFNTDICT